MSATARNHFEGHAERECGEHRSLGGRAWCHECSEYCYPDGPCKGCELPQLRHRLATLEKVADAAREYVEQEATEREGALLPPPHPKRNDPYSRAILALQEDVDTLAVERDELRRELSRHLGSDQCALAVPIPVQDP